MNLSRIPLLAIAILLVAPAEATTSYYVGASGETTFNGAVGGMTLIDLGLTFSGTPGSAGLLNASGPGIDFPGFDTALSFGIHPTVAAGSGNWCVDLTRGGCANPVANISPSDVQFFGFVSPTAVNAPLYIHY